MLQSTAHTGCVAMGFKQQLLLGSQEPRTIQGAAGVDQTEGTTNLFFRVQLWGQQLHPSGCHHVCDNFLLCHGHDSTPEASGWT